MRETTAAHHRVRKLKFLVVALACIAGVVVAIVLRNNWSADSTPFASHATYENTVKLAGHLEQRNEALAIDSRGTSCVPEEEVDAELLRDGWQRPLQLTLHHECKKGGCVYGVRSVGSDGTRDTMDDGLKQFVIGDCSDENFSEAYLPQVDLYVTQGSLRGATFQGANLQGFSGSEANLARVSFRQANMSCWQPEACTSLLEANLEQADLEGVMLHGARLLGASLRGANLSEGNFVSVDFTQADLRDARLVNADLSSADLTGSDLRGADLTGASLEGTTVTGVQWSGATCPDGSTARTPQSAQASQAPCNILK